MPKRQRYLVATDGSASGQAAVRCATELARRSGAVISILHVRRAPLPVLGCPFYQRALSEELAQARAILDAAAGEVGAADVMTEVDILEGDAAERIIELARHREVDLVIVGSRGLGAVASAILGSVSESVVSNADCPVLVVRPPAAAARRAA